MMKKLFVQSLLVLSLGACSTMYFDNGKHATKELDASEWHHIGILQLVEFSSPVDLNSRCEEKGWRSVKVEESFVHGVVNIVTNNLYTPWGVEYACKTR